MNLNRLLIWLNITAFYPLFMIKKQIGKDDESKIHGHDAVCPVCDQVLSKSLMKPVDINPNDEWIKKAMAGVPPPILQDEENSSVLAKMRGNAKKFSEKLVQVHTAYQNLGKRCQMIEQEIESLSKEKQELQEKFSENSRAKRKVDEMYDQLRSKYQSLKRSTIQHANNFYARNEPGLFTNPATNMMDSKDPIRRGLERMYGQRDRTVQPLVLFDISSGSPAMQADIPVVMSVSQIERSTLVFFFFA
ncbi:hypothetical protein PVK06_000463 [Gossypium arboreum]|uniref:E3 ubiquitin-protein ligase CCNB1IP1 homolog n=1 Tax=Gossypium arboreum TaxID=29729 RepID=A0ABR0QZN5_GOSAR|nr:hypothetical protein PVK06_000463 [Gossypium arboreum]